MKTTGIVLLNLGGPDDLESVEPFLKNLFSDRDIIKLGPSFLQKPIAWFIAKKRAPKSQEYYRKIGGKSPINDITRQQASALEKELNSHGHYIVTVAMRYCSPRAVDAVEVLRSHNVDQIVLLPLYPHYSKATNGSSLKDIKKILGKCGFSPSNNKVKIIEQWPDQPDYIKCLSDLIKEKRDALHPKKTALLYSAHNLPVSFIQNGDPYVDQLHKTIEEVEKLTSFPGKLCYQSRSGPVEWMTPSTSETIRKTAEEGYEAVIIVPISFVSDHVETLYEIDILFREEAQSYGIQLEKTDGLNCRPLFIKALKNLVLDIV